MKKIILWPLALLLVLFATSARADVAQDLAQLLDGLPSYFKVEYSDLKANAQGNEITLDDVKISYYPVESKGIDIPPEELELYQPYQMFVDKVVITNPNPAPLASADVVPLADKIQFTGIKVVYSEIDMHMTLKQAVLTKPSGPWAEIIRLSGFPEKRKQFIQQLLQIHLNAFLYEDIRIVDNESYDPIQVLIAKINGQDCSFLKCSDIIVDSFMIKPLKEARAKDQHFSMDKLVISYDIVEPMNAWLSHEDNDIENFNLSLNRYPYSFSFDALKIQSAIDDMPFTIKQVQYSQSNKDDYQGKLLVDTFQINTKDMSKYSFFSRDDMTTLLKGKPFVLTIKGQSRLAPGKFYPNTFSVLMPNLGNFEFSANLALTKDYMDIWDRHMPDLGDMYDPFGNLSWVLKSTLVKNSTMSYQDKGFINGLLTLYGKDRGMNLSQSRQKALGEFDEMIRYEEPGFMLDFMKSVKGLINKPGTLTLSINPKNPMTMGAIFDNLERTPGNVNYKFNLK